MKVLVCDDDDKFLEIIREYLQQIGVEQNLQLEILGGAKHRRADGTGEKESGYSTGIFRYYI